MTNINLNPALEMVNCYTKYFDLQEKELNKLIDKLKVSNIQIKVISDVMNKLAHGKQKDKKFDPAGDEQARMYAYLIHQRNPTIFEGKIHGVPADETGLEERLTTAIAELREEGRGEDLDAILAKLGIDPSVQFDALDEAEIDVVVQGLDAELKMLNADLNERLMNINSKYEDRSQMTENARQVVKEADELNKSIIQKSSRG